MDVLEMINTVGGNNNVVLVGFNVDSNSG